MDFQRVNTWTCEDTDETEAWTSGVLDLTDLGEGATECGAPGRGSTEVCEALGVGTPECLRDLREGIPGVLF